MRGDTQQYHLILERISRSPLPPLTKVTLDSLVRSTSEGSDLIEVTAADLSLITGISLRKVKEILQILSNDEHGLVKTKRLGGPKTERLIVPEKINLLADVRITRSREIKDYFASTAPPPSTVSPPTTASTASPPTTASTALNRHFEGHAEEGAKFGAVTVILSVEVSPLGGGVTWTCNEKVDT